MLLGALKSFKLPAPCSFLCVAENAGYTGVKQAALAAQMTAD